jgi:protein involved in polysaccharide export with SLBB domain
MQHRIHTFVRSALLVCAGAVLAACAGSSSPAPEAFVPPTPSEPPAEYVIQRGDTLSVKFYYHSDQDQEVVVRPDGKIPLSLGMDTQAAGLTSAQLAEEITQRYSANLRDPKVTVSIKALNPRGIYVGGEVGRPGFVPYRPGMTALQAIFDAGGAKNTAKVSDVVLIQRSVDDRYRASKVNLEKVMSQGDLSGDLPLGPSDIVFVPRTAVANANLFVEQYIINMLPVRPSLPLIP